MTFRRIQDSSPEISDLVITFVFVPKTAGGRWGSPKPPEGGAIGHILLHDHTWCGHEVHIMHPLPPAMDVHDND